MNRLCLLLLMAGLWRPALAQSESAPLVFRIGKGESVSTVLGDNADKIRAYIPREREWRHLRPYPLVRLLLERNLRHLPHGVHPGNEIQISKTAAALHYWLDNERNDLPMEITKMSFASFNTPITDNGTLPVKLFGRELNLHRLEVKKIPWLICYGRHDDLVEPAAALAPLDHIEAEVSAFPKGHVAIATSWSDPSSVCALHTRFGDRQQRGPVRFQLDLEKAMQAKTD